DSGAATASGCRPRRAAVGSPDSCLLLFERDHPSGERIELFETCVVLAPGPGLHQRRAGRILAWFVDRVADHAGAGDHHAVADLQVSHHADCAAQQAIAADARAAGDAGATRDGGMRADADVVPDLDQVVDADVFLEFGVLQRAAVDAGVGADLAI